MEKKIHYCWFGGKKLPKSVEQCIKTWKKQLPDYEIIEWNENNFDINVCPFVKQAYENKKWAFVSDYARIYALYNEGGIYFDTDVKVLKNIEHIIDKDMVLGYEDSGFFGTAFISVKEKHNKHIKEILDYYNKLDEFNPEIMYNYANPVIITKTIRKYDSYIDNNGIEIFDNSVYVYPRDYFFPLSYNYAEKEFTENTCMIHLFNATWTSRGERRTIGIYRKLGPDLGRIVNNFIDGLGNLKQRTISKLKEFYTYWKMWYSIHINRNKRVKNIIKELELKKENYLVICNPDKAIENQYINTLFDNNILYLREQHTEKEANMIANAIYKSGKQKVIFNSYSDGWDKLISNLKMIKRNIEIEVLIHGGNERSANKNVWQSRDEIIVLYAKRKIDKLLFFNKQLCEYYKEKGYKTEFLTRKIEIEDKRKYKKDEKSSFTKIGMYVTDHDSSNNIFSQLSAVSLLENIKLDFNPINYEIATTARRFKINLIGDSKALSQEELYYRIANNDVNLCINLIDNDSLIPLQSFELGVVCIIGRGVKFFEGSELEKYIKVSDEENIQEIKQKIQDVLENKEKILELYNSWKKDEE